MLAHQACAVTLAKAVATAVELSTDGLALSEAGKPSQPPSNSVACLVPAVPTAALCARALGVDDQFIALVEAVCAPRVHLHRLEVDEVHVRARVSAAVGGGAFHVGAQRVPLHFKRLQLRRVLAAPDRLMNEVCTRRVGHCSYRVFLKTNVKVASHSSYPFTAL